jgi:hypothetical protein
MKHQVGEHRFAGIVHLAAPGARCEDVERVGQRDIGSAFALDLHRRTPNLPVALGRVYASWVLGLIGLGLGAGLADRFRRWLRLRRLVRWSW